MKIFDWKTMIDVDNYTIVLNKFTMWLTGLFKIFLHQSSLDSKQNSLMKHSWLRFFKLNWIYITMFVLFKQKTKKLFKRGLLNQFQMENTQLCWFTAFVQNLLWYFYFAYQLLCKNSSQNLHIFEKFCAFIFRDYNTITDLSYKKTRWLTNKRRKLFNVFSQKNREKHVMNLKNVQELFQIHILQRLW